MPIRSRLAALAALLPLAACATASAPPRATVCPPSRGWQAWIDAMPGPGAQLRLIVVGEVDLPAGSVARLRPGPLDRMMPPGQRFILEVSPGRGPSGWQEVRRELKPAQTVYREVVIGCGDREIGLVTEIETAH